MEHPTGSDMHLGLTADEVLTTTRAVRKRLDLSRPVEKEMLVECLDLAMQAPTGSNQQGWEWVFVTDPDLRRRVAEVYREKFNINAAANRAKDPVAVYGANDIRAEGFGKLMGSVGYLAEIMGDVPVLMIPCVKGRVETTSVNVSAGQWGSILPAVWSFMLALRERGLGSAWTTAHLKEDGEQRVAEILGIPVENYTQAGLFPIAYTIGTDFRPARRLPAESVMHLNRW
jgi:nitroreductase